MNCPEHTPTLTEFIQNRHERAPRLQVLRPQPVQRDEQERLLLEAAQKTQRHTQQSQKAGHSADSASPCRTRRAQQVLTIILHPLRLPYNNTHDDLA